MNDAADVKLSRTYNKTETTPTAERSVAGHPGLGAGRPVDEGVGEPDGQFTDGAFGAVAAVDQIV